MSEFLRCFFSFGRMLGMLFAQLSLACSLQYTKHFIFTRRLVHVFKQQSHSIMLTQPPVHSGYAAFGVEQFHICASMWSFCQTPDIIFLCVTLLCSSYLSDMVEGECDFTEYDMFLSQVLGSGLGLGLWLLHCTQHHVKFTHIDNVVHKLSTFFPFMSD